MHKLIRTGIVAVAYVAFLMGTLQATVLSGTVKYTDGTNFNGQIVLQLPSAAVRDKCNQNQIITAKSIIIPVINGIIQNSNDFVPLDCTDPPTPYDVAYKDKYGSVIFQDRWWVGPPSGITISNVQGDTNIYPLLPDVVSLNKGGYKLANTNVFVGSNLVNWNVPFQKQVGTDYIIACNLTDQNSTLQISSVLPLSTTQAVVSITQTNTDCRGCDTPTGMICRARQTGAGIITSPVVLTATATSVVADASTVNQGTAIQFTATVTPIPTGIVNFVADGGISLGLVPVDLTGTAILSNNGLQPGTHQVTAFYYGSNLYQSSISTPITIQIIPAPKTNTTLSLTANPVSATAGTQVSLIAQISPTTATGTITFYDGATLLATLPVSNAGATFVSSTLAVGAHTVSATYSGDSSFNGSSSGPVSLIIAQSGGIQSTTQLTASPTNPSANQSVTLTASVTGSSIPAPSGDAIFTDGGIQIGKAGIVNGNGFITTTFAIGTHNLACNYSGDTLNKPSTGILTLNVNSSGTCSFQPTTDLVSQTGNNTSACSGSNLYCNAQFIGMTDTQAGIITPRFNSAPGHVSDVKINNYLYSGNTTKIMAHLMPWFCQPSSAPPGGYNGSQTCGGHIATGYDSVNANLISAQAIAMQRVGLSGWVMDWYKQHDNVALAWKTYFANNPSSTLVFAMMEDGNGTPKTNCPQNGTDQTTCLTSAFNSDLDYLNATYFGNSKYDTDGGRPVVYFFVNEGSWASPTNWTTVWTNVKSHTGTYSNPPKFIFENASGATHTSSDGAFSWLAPFSLTGTASQEDWAQSYYTGFYDTLAPLYSSKLAVGSLKKGFDDFFASWKPSPNRVTGQQCGQVVQFVANQITHSGDFGTGQQLKKAQLATWNDYEEGTELETGIDNCLTVTATSITGGNVINWTLNSSSVYSSTNTIDHFDIWLADGSSPARLMKIGSATSTATSFNFGSACIPSGSWKIYVEMVGRPLIINRMSNGLAYNNAPGAPPVVSSISPNTGPTGGGTVVTITGTNFRSGARVAIGGPLATSITVVSSTQITATTPPGSNGAATVTVTNSDGTTNSLVGGFTYFTTGQGGIAITIQGTGQGQIISSPAGIRCPALCSATFPIGTTVTLTESPQ